MSSTRRVPETGLMARDKMAVDDAYHAIRNHGLRRLLHDAFLRFRYGDGFSHARALGLQLCLAVVPFLIALTGLSAKLGLESGGRVVADTVLTLSPGASEALFADLLSGSERTDDTGEVALTFGLITGLLALTTVLAQVERGANRIYGDERDRPALRKYVRAAVLSVLAGGPAFAGFLILVAGGSIGDSVERWYHWGSTADDIWDVARWPLSLALTVFGVSLMFHYSPRRRQPTLSWLMFGATVATLLWVLASSLLAVYVRTSGAFGEVYGALAGVMALLLWANLTGIALFLGLALCAQIEGYRVGVEEPVEADHWERTQP